MRKIKQIHDVFPQNSEQKRRFSPVYEEPKTALHRREGRLPMTRAPGKRLGQHFLHEKRYLSQIIDLADIAPGEDVLEIGVGEGALTRFLLKAGANVHGVEIDDALIPALRALEGASERFRLIHADALALDYEALPGKMKVAANLPYQIASAIILQLIEKFNQFPLMILMVQREVGERLCAEPGGKDYGALTLRVGYRFEARLCEVVPPGAFRPPPKVDSALMRLGAREKPQVKVEDESLYFRIIQAGFAHRRKTLINNLKSLNSSKFQGKKRGGLSPEDWRALLKGLEIDPGRRAETLEAREFARIARAVESAMGRT